MVIVMAMNWDKCNSHLDSDSAQNKNNSTVDRQSNNLDYGFPTTQSMNPMDSILVSLCQL